MHRFSANISTLFTEAPLIKRFALAAEAGFEHIEIQFPYELSKQTIKTALFENQLSLDLINIPAGNLAQGDLGIACLPSRVDEFKQSVAVAIDYANFLNVKKINCLAGIKPAELSNNSAQETFLQNIEFAAEQLRQHNKTLLIEAINTQTVPGFFINSTQQVIELINELQQENIKMQYDCYHMQIMEGNLINTLTNNIQHIGHIQVADVPNRSEPGSGEINFPNIFNALAILGYTDCIGLEYFPINSTQDGLTTLQPLLNLKGEKS